MATPFENLDKEKQKRIINAALKEFADKGFKQASTNKIVKEAGIGKGMLFYYFKNKKGLYFYLIDYSLEIIEQKFLNIIDMRERDLFARLTNIAELKMDFLKKYPNAMNFMATVFFQDDHVDEETTAKIKKIQHIGDEKTYKNVDFSLFRDDVDAEKAFQIIRWVFDGYEASLKKRLRNQDLREFDLDPYWDEFYEYIDVMKKSFYK